MDVDLTEISDEALLMQYPEVAREITNAHSELIEACVAYDAMPYNSRVDDLNRAGQQYAKALAALNAVEAEMVRRWGNST